MTNIDILCDAILTVMGFVFGIYSYFSIQTLHRHIEELEDKIKRM